MKQLFPEPTKQKHLQSHKEAKESHLGEFKGSFGLQLLLDRNILCASTYARRNKENKKRDIGKLLNKQYFRLLQPKISIYALFHFS